jgi:hypothetical protein
MCIFNHPVKEVRQTRILASPTKDNRALIIYENYVGTTGGERGAKQQAQKQKLEEKQAEERANQNAMILPAPLKEGNKIQVLDLSNGAFKFDHCDLCFPREAKVEKRAFLASALKQKPLEVISVGAYSVSLALNFADLGRIDETVFKVAPNIEEILRKHYEKGFGFVICCFDPTKKIEPHPIGYISDLEESGSVFIPTRHEHGDEEGNDHLAHFDHKIFSVNSPSLGESIGDVAKHWGINGTTPSRSPESLFSAPVFDGLIPEVLQFRRHTIRGKKENTDFHIVISDEVDQIGRDALAGKKLDTPMETPKELLNFDSPLPGVDSKLRVVG